MSKVRPTEAELEILQVLWQQGPATVRTVHDHLHRVSDKAVGYTTTLKLMQIMFEKGLLTRNTDQRSHVYAADVGESAVQRSLLQQFVDKTFRGSATRLVMEALGQHQASEAELAQIKALIKQMEDQQKDT
ncbi:MAG: BlaI/MecI/CopY family transcriptional regulator [Lewinella sp.]|nr:BlaI/MecI/CopY family transcriptional regulator [Lewinella sp.]